VLLCGVAPLCGVITTAVRRLTPGGFCRLLAHHHVRAPLRLGNSHRCSVLASDHLAYQYLRRAHRVGDVAHAGCVCCYPLCDMARRD